MKVIVCNILDKRGNGYDKQIRNTKVCIDVSQPITPEWTNELNKNMAENWHRNKLAYT